MAEGEWRHSIAAFALEERMVTAPPCRTASASKESPAGRDADFGYAGNPPPVAPSFTFMSQVSSQRAARAAAPPLSGTLRPGLPLLLYGIRLWAAVCLALFVAF